MAVALIALLSVRSGPTQAAGPSPDPQSTITVRFVNDGEPVSVLGGYQFFADGADCRGAHPAVIMRFGNLSFSWPSRYVIKEECTKGPPTTLRFEFGVVEPGGEGGMELSDEAVWVGNDLDFEFSVPDELVYGPAVFPDGLPATGGPPVQGSFPAAWLLIAGAGLVISSAAFMISQLPGQRKA